MPADRDVYATAEVHRERFGCGRFRYGTSADEGLAYRLECIAIYVRVRSAKQQLTIGLEMMCAHFDLRTDKVSEQITLDVSLCARGKNQIGSNVKCVCTTGEPLQIHLDAEEFVDVNIKLSTATLQAVGVRVGCAGA